MEKFEEAYKKSFEVDGGSIVRNSFYGSFGWKAWEDVMWIKNCLFDF